MATQYDFVKITLGGTTYAMPKKSALMLFDILSTQEVWKLETWWGKNYQDNKLVAIPIEHTEHVQLQGLNPVLFHAALEAQRQREEVKRVEEAEKAKAASNA